jgi:hypothetical protein
MQSIKNRLLYKTKALKADISTGFFVILIAAVILFYMGDSGNKNENRNACKN